MKHHVQFLLVAAGTCASLMTGANAFAQGATRQQVVKELAQYEAAGFNPVHENPTNWVNDAQSATTKVSAALESHIVATNVAKRVSD